MTVCHKICHVFVLLSRESKNIVSAIYGLFNRVAFFKKNVWFIRIAFTKNVVELMAGRRYCDLFVSSFQVVPSAN